MAGVVRLLRWFEKDPGDRLVGEAVMLNAELEELQALFNVPSDNPMYDCWPVEPAQAPAISALAAVPVDLSQFDYYVEADATSDGPP